LKRPPSATAAVHELRGHALVGCERVELLHSGHAAVVQWYIAAGRLAQCYSSPAGKLWTRKPTELRSQCFNVTDAFCAFWGIYGISDLESRL